MGKQVFGTQPIYNLPMPAQTHSIDTLPEDTMFYITFSPNEKGNKKDNCNSHMFSYLESKQENQKCKRL